MFSDQDATDFTDNAPWNGGVAVCLHFQIRPPGDESDSTTTQRFSASPSGEEVRGVLHN